MRHPFRGAITIPASKGTSIKDIENGLLKPLNFQGVQDKIIYN
jgi:hypothetical protein